MAFTVIFKFFVAESVSSDTVSNKSIVPLKSKSGTTDKLPFTTVIVASPSTISAVIVNTSSSTSLTYRFKSKGKPVHSVQSSSIT